MLGVAEYKIFGEACQEQLLRLRVGNGPHLLLRLRSAFSSHEQTIPLVNQQPF